MADWVIQRVPESDLKQYGFSLTGSQIDKIATWKNDVLEIVEEPKLGRTMRARVDIPAGALLLSEPPLVRTVPLDSLEEVFKERYKEAAKTLNCVGAPFVDIHAYLQAPPAIRAALLSSCCTFQLEQRQTEEDRKEVPGIQELARRAANWACANLEECREMNPDELVQAQGVFALNAHNLGELPGAAVYLIGSKLSHACVDANTVYHYQPDLQVGHHRALRAIAKGEVLTSDYMGFLSVCSTYLRQAYLHSSKLFLCRCATCCRPDLPRALPCPSCFPRSSAGLLEEAELVGTNNVWVAHPYIVRTPAGPHPHPEVDGVWRCNCCHTQFSDDQVNVKVTHSDETADLFVWDRKIEMIVHTLMQKAPIVDPSSGDICPALKGRLPFMLESFTQIVGVQHWTTMELRSVQLDQWLWMCMNTRGKKLHDALSASDYFYPSKECFYNDVWNTVEVLWEWMQRCNFTGVWATVGELIAARQIVEIVGDNKRRFRHLLEETAARVIIEHGMDSIEVTSLMETYSDLEEEFPQLFDQSSDIPVDSVDYLSETIAAAKIAVAEVDCRGRDADKKLNGEENQVVEEVPGGGADTSVNDEGNKVVEEGPHDEFDK